MSADCTIPVVVFDGNIYARNMAARDQKLKIVAASDTDLLCSLDSTQPNYSTVDFTDISKYDFVFGLSLYSKTGLIIDLIEATDITATTFRIPILGSVTQTFIGELYFYIRNRILGNSRLAANGNATFQGAPEYFPPNIPDVSVWSVSRGGTGKSSWTPYVVVCGGDPLKEVSGVGTSGQVLTSNGDGLLPTWEDATGGGGGGGWVGLATTNLNMASHSIFGVTTGTFSGALSAASFSGAGTGLTGTASSLIVGSAANLVTARNIVLAGTVTGTASFNGSANTTITATLSDISSTYLTVSSAASTYMPQTGGTFSGAIGADGGNVPVYKGTILCNTNPNYPAATVGWFYKVGAAGKIGGSSGLVVEFSDLIFCTITNVGGDFATAGGDFIIVKGNQNTTVVTTTASQTISNKTFTAPVVGAATGTSLSLSGSLTADALGCNTIQAGSVSVGSNIALNSDGSGQFLGGLTASNLSGTNTGNQNLFASVVVSGQTTVTTASTSQALTFVGSGITITTDNSTKTITFTVSGAGLGDVVGPSSVTDGNVALFDGTTGKLIKQAGTTLPSTIVGSSLTAVGTISSGSWAGTLITSAFGGTGNGFTKFSGPTTAERTKTVRDVSDTILELGGSYTPTGTYTNMILITPACGTPSAIVLTNATGTASSLVVSAANLTGATLASGILTTSITKVGTLASPTMTTPVLGAAGGTSLSLSGTITATGGTLTSTTFITPALGTPASGVLTNCTGLPVAGGGTGLSSVTAYAVLCGGTTSSGALQPLSSVGTAGQILTSNGAGALPTWQAPSGGTTGTSLFNHFADVSTTSTNGTFDDLYSDTIAAGQLTANGDKIVGQYGGTMVQSATATRNLRVLFGGTTIYDSGALTTNVASGAWSIGVFIVRVDSATVRCKVVCTVDGVTATTTTTYTSVGSLTLSATQVLKVSAAAAGTGAASSDMTAKLSNVSYIGA